MIIVLAIVCGNTLRVGFSTMPSRTFVASDGDTWTVWLVQPARQVGPLAGIPTAWLAFQNAAESERRRLRDFPLDWTDLGDERLELLRRVAEAVNRPSGNHPIIEPRKSDDSQRVEL